MPDISLLQREPYDFQEKERMLPGAVLTFCLILLIISVGAYVGLYLYNRFLLSEAEALAKRVSEQRLGEVEQTVGELEQVGNQVKILKTLREGHTHVSSMLTRLERSTHPLAYFTSGDFDVQKGTVALQGFIPTTVLFARQIEVYVEMMKDHIANFTIENVGYGENQQVTFHVTLQLKK